jgi:hypothetical protein
MTRKISYTYTPPASEDTCKTSFAFELLERQEDDDTKELIIADLVISGSDGCLGQNKTIPVLVKGRKVQELSIDELQMTRCSHANSCAQSLAKALTEIIEKYIL